MDDFNVDSLDFDKAEADVLQKLEIENAQTFETSDEDECEGGACKI